jgi:hypothetical protein
LHDRELRGMNSFEIELTDEKLTLSRKLVSTTRPLGRPAASRWGVVGSGLQARHLQVWTSLFTYYFFC